MQHEELTSTNKRLRELDFLRGMAILLVLLNHIPLFTFTQRMGWIGVDLFFVLSGFLVSGLLFKEYLKFGNIHPVRFLIRRGFKIYPIYYLFLIPYLILKVYQGDFEWLGFISDITFTQNYIWGMGYLYGASWSLAVEEHFYFGFALLLFILLKFRPDFPKKLFITVICGLMALSLVLRLIDSPVLIESRENFVQLFSPTHLRMDSLLFGVLISYFYHFRFTDLKQFFYKQRILLLIIMLFGLCWTPFISRFSHSIYSQFALTFGLTLIYISFGILLVAFLLTEKINISLNKYLSKSIVNLISKIGFCSYSIYVIHTLVIRLTHICINHFNLSSLQLDNRFVFFIISASISIAIGMVMTYKIEKWFLAIRNKYYPSRV